MGFWVGDMEREASVALVQALCLELATMGDLKLVERPQNYTLSPGAQKTIRCARSRCLQGVARRLIPPWVTPGSPLLWE